MLFGNNMSWLYGKLKKKLDAPATAGSAGDVLTLGESGKPEWGEGGGGGSLPEVTSTDEGKVLTVVDNDGTYEWEAAELAASSPIILYPTSDVPTGEPEEISGEDWAIVPQSFYLSDTLSGTAKTYSEFKNIVTHFHNGTPIYLDLTASNSDFQYGVVKIINAGHIFFDNLGVYTDGLFISYASLDPEEPVLASVAYVYSTDK